MVQLSQEGRLLACVRYWLSGQSSGTSQIVPLSSVVSPEQGNPQCTQTHSSSSTISPRRKASHSSIVRSSLVGLMPLMVQLSRVQQHLLDLVIPRKLFNVRFRLLVCGEHPLDAPFLYYVAGPVVNIVK
jgi:hypothetical protein